MTDSNSIESSTLPASEQRELKDIALQRDEYDEEHSYLNRLHRPGDTEFSALFHLAVCGAMHAWGGLIFVGVVVGVPFFIVGAVVGAVLVAWVAIVPLLLATSLFLTLRGRLPIAWLMGWAGSLVGVLCGSVSQMMGRRDLWESLVTDAPLLIPFALIGAFVAWWACSRGVRRFYLIEGLGTRPATRFGIADLLLITLWLSVMLTLLRASDSELLAGFIPPFEPVRFALSIPLAWGGIAFGKAIQPRWPRKKD